MQFQGRRFRALKSFSFNAQMAAARWILTDLEAKLCRIQPPQSRGQSHYPARVAEDDAFVFPGFAGQPRFSIVPQFLPP